MCEVLFFFFLAAARDQNSLDRQQQQQQQAARGGSAPARGLTEGRRRTGDGTEEGRMDGWRDGGTGPGQARPGRPLRNHGWLLSRDFVLALI